MPVRAQVAMAAHSGRGGGDVNKPKVIMGGVKEDVPL